MILDSLTNAGRYTALHTKFATVFAFLADPSVRALESGRIEIEGKDVYAIASAGSGKAAADARLEAHHRYIDVHYLVSGRESMGWKSVERCLDTEQPYDDEKDIILYSDDPAIWFTIHPGSFAVFFPWDAHAPMVSGGAVRKIVAKVLL